MSTQSNNEDEDQKGEVSSPTEEDDVESGQESSPSKKGGETLKEDEPLNPQLSRQEIFREEEEPLDPPLSRQEIFRDDLLGFLDNNKYIMYMNILVLFLVVASGAGK
jgi:hypothetical protein